jgi:5-methyltetrahydropteroyltriglutamate--homocysteine methyltransferase
VAIASNLGFPRIGAQRELKKALEAFWSGKLDEDGLLAAGKALRQRHWQLQQQLGMQHIPSNDFSYYDQVLDTIAMAGAIPARYGWSRNQVDFATYFAMARGVSEKTAQGSGIPAMEMTKWFDTNYHYIVPEFEVGQKFQLASLKAVEELREAKALGIQTRPVLLGPVSFLLLGKSKDEKLSPLSLLDNLLPVYSELLSRLQAAGADWIQFDEPCLVFDLPDHARQAFASAYKFFATNSQLKILLATYFEGLADNLTTALELTVAAVHIDLVRAPGQLGAVLDKLSAKTQLSLGLIDGRNIWKTNLPRVLKLAQQAAARIGQERLLIAPSCSLLHSPVDLTLEAHLQPELKSWLAFATQKLEEITVLTRALNEGEAAVREELKQNQVAMESRRTSPQIHNPEIKANLAAVSASMLQRKSPHNERRTLQQRQLGLPLFPTTTIGSFPQTAEVRAARAGSKSGKIGPTDYDTFLKQEIEKAIRFQEEIDIDVLVHGEFERNDMVEYFGEQLSGFAATGNGWIQSYGSRCVKPPIIYGDVERLQPMTVTWSRYAQSLTPRPVKGMLTGPVTILQWSLVRDDQPREVTCRQIALAIRAEALDLEQAGIKVIQIDEPAVREGLPLRRADWGAYLEWAVHAFRLSASGVRDETQIHTHMCYAEFNDIIEAVGAMDADVISIETSRSKMELLGAFAEYHYPNEIGPGVYDIHSPRIPTQKEMEDLLRAALRVLPKEQLWVNPDCGLKTRRWEEVKPALIAMVRAAKVFRAQFNF